MKKTKSKKGVFFCGIDLSASPKHTGLCVLTMTEGKLKAIAKPIEGNFRAKEWTDESINCLVEFFKSKGIFEHPCNEIVLAIDVPFGWPTSFAEALENFRIGGSTGDKWGTRLGRQKLRFRQTDLFVWGKLRKSTLSVSTDRLGITAMAGAAIISELARRLRFSVDLSGANLSARRRIIEVYPIGSARSFLDSRRSSQPPKNSFARERMLLLRNFHGGAHARDALLCALTAKSYYDRQCYFPSELGREHQGQIKKEGWIWLPRTGGMAQTFLS